MIIIYILIMTFNFLAILYLLITNFASVSTLSAV